MLSPEQYKLLTEMRQNIEANLTRIENEIDALKADDVKKAAELATAQVAFDLYRTTTAQGEAQEAILTAQRQQASTQVSRLNSHKRQIADRIEAKRAEIAACKDRLGLFSNGAIKGEMRLYEKVHVQ